ncbi:MAG: hypothetical protein LC797_23245 [Chloroflexi bacterium]|nr:hypothetical protein [Chloroflexota bacterium]
MKLLTTVLIACLAALVVYAARRRIVFALKSGAVVYVVVIFGRLLFSLDRWEDLVWPVAIMLIAWAVLWVASTNYAERRAKRSR